MQIGILLGLLTYFSFTVSDALIKAVGAGLPVFEIGFFVSVFAIVPSLFTKRRADRWADVFIPNNPKLVAVRMAAGTLGGILSVYAFTTLPLADAYSLLFLQPAFVTILSRVLLKEEVGRWRWAAVFVGLAGVLLVIRPGFREILPGHFAAAAGALCGASTVIVVRFLGPTERRVTLIGSIGVAAALVNGVLMVPTYVTPPASLFHLLVLAGLTAGIGHVLMVFATRQASAAQVGPTQYSQIIWATIIGVVAFSEVPDAVAILGMALVAGSGLLTFAREAVRRRWPRTPLVRPRI